VKVNTILFDMDGTLRDSRSIIQSAIYSALEIHGMKKPKPEHLLDTIHNLRDVHAAHAEDHIEYEVFRASYYQALTPLLHEVVVYEKVHETLSKLKKGGYLLGVVSSARFAREALNQDGLTDYFNVVITGADTVNHKPHPEPIELALRKLGVKPNQAVMVGDLPADIQAAKSAKLAAAIGVTHGFGTRNMLKAANADNIIDGMGELLVLMPKL
jgi:pyrophosphatase PpaX